MKSVRRPAALVLVSAGLTALLAGCAGFDSAPGTGPTWSVIPESPLSARRSPVAAWVAERFVVVGGWSDAMCPTNADCAWPNGAPLQDAAAFDPATGRWQQVAAAPMGVAAASTAVLGDALYVLTADLGLDEAPRSLLKFTPDDDLWTSLPLPPGEPSQLLAAGTVLVAVTDSDERMTAIDSVFDPATQAWSTLPDDPLGPSFDRQAVWIGDRVLLTAKDLVPSPGSEEPSVNRFTAGEPIWRGTRPSSRSSLSSRSRSTPDCRRRERVTFPRSTGHVDAVDPAIRAGTPHAVRCDPDPAGHPRD